MRSTSSPTASSGPSRWPTWAGSPAPRTRLGAGPAPIPVTATVSGAGTGLTRTGTTQVNTDVDLPSIAAIHLLSNFDRTFQKIGEGTSAVRWIVTGRTGSGRAFTLTRSNRFASQLHTQNRRR